MQQQQSFAAATSDSGNSSDEASVSEVKEDDFFTFISQDTSSATADNILSTYTGNTITSLDDLHAYPLLNIFLELNTALLASAKC